ncbi:Putative serine/threonine-protein kinase pknH [Minicystis rosea]|nr:Putative serine/threonine-protein kinase pknH [Minicystis rosea]
MGSVWVARHLQLDVDVAVKFMSPQLAASPEAQARFEREAKAAAMLKMANAVSVFDYGMEGDTPFMVMELLEGEDLQARLLRGGTLRPAELRAVLEPVCKVVRRAHELGLVHRDLKPGNIFLARQGGEEIIKVLDFGIAKDTGSALGGSATQTGAMLGSPHYMSPEQVRSTNRVDHRTDLWALGVIAFQCLTGRLPFHGDEVGEVLVEVCTAPIPVPSTLVPSLGPHVDSFFARALDRDPARRFQSAAELYDALAALVAPAQASAPAFAQASAPAFAQAAQASAQAAPAFAQASTPAFAPAAAPAQASAPIVATLSPSVHTAHIVPGRSGRGVAIAAVIAGGALTLAGVAFIALRMGSHGAAPAPAASAAPSATIPEPPASAPAPLPSTSVSAGIDAPAAAPSASASASSSAKSTAPSKDPRGRPSNRKPSGKSKNGDDPLDHM